MKLGRLGVWYSTDKLNGAQLADLMGTIEKNGYSAFWYPESRGYESMSLGAYLLSKSEQARRSAARSPTSTRAIPTPRGRAMISMNDWYGGRYILGLGVSHIPMVEGLRGHRYDKPLGAMRAYLDGIHKDLRPARRRRSWSRRWVRRCWS